MPLTQPVTLVGGGQEDVGATVDAGEDLRGLAVDLRAAEREA